MGVDIYGKSPKLKSERPQLLMAWEEASSYDKEMYYNSLDIWEHENPGVYFRSNWWGWRPIHAIADMAIHLKGLPFNTDHWGSNDGKGLENQEQCTQLADAIDEFLTINHVEMHEEEDRFYLCLGSWCTSEGGFIGSDITEQLDNEYPMGTILYRGVVASNGQLVFPSHSCNLSRIKSFITFLRNCGGFEIW